MFSSSSEAYLLFYRKQKGKILNVFNADRCVVRNTASYLVGARHEFLLYLLFVCAADCKGVVTPPGIPPDISDSVEMREAEDAEGGAEVEALTLTNSKEETGTENQCNDQDVILGHRDSPGAMSGDEGRDEKMKKDEEGKTGVDEREMESETTTAEFQDDVKVENHKHNTLGDDQRFNHGVNKSNEEQEELGTDVRKTEGQEDKTENYVKSRRNQRESQFKPSPKNNEDTVERIHEPKPSRSLDGIMNEEEIQRGTKCIKTETSQGCTEMSVKSEDGKRDPEPMDTKFPKSFDGLKLGKSKRVESLHRTGQQSKTAPRKKKRKEEKQKKTKNCFTCGVFGYASNSD